MTINSNNINVLFSRINLLVQQELAVKRLWTEFRLVQVGNYMKYILFFFCELLPVPKPPDPPPQIVFNFGPISRQIIPDISLPDEPA